MGLYFFCKFSACFLLIGWKKGRKWAERYLFSFYATTLTVFFIKNAKVLCSNIRFCVPKQGFVYHGKVLGTKLRF